MPCISNEIRNKITEFNNIIAEVDASQDSDHWAELLQEYSRLRAQMKARMEELAVFYDENIDEEKIQFFEKQRLKLKRALFNRPGKNKGDLHGHDGATNTFLTEHDDEDLFERAPLS